MAAAALSDQLSEKVDAQKLLEFDLPALQQLLSDARQLVGRTTVERDAKKAELSAWMMQYTAEHGGKQADPSLIPKLLVGDYRQASGREGGREGYGIAVSCSVFVDVEWSDVMSLSLVERSLVYVDKQS